MIRKRTLPVPRTTTSKENKNEKWQKYDYSKFKDQQFHISPHPIQFNHIMEIYIYKSWKSTWNNMKFTIDIQVVVKNWYQNRFWSEKYRTYFYGCFNFNLLSIGWLAFGSPFIISFPLLLEKIKWKCIKLPRCFYSSAHLGNPKQAAAADTSLSFVLEEVVH